jgi:hypothetical protein
MPSTPNFSWNVAGINNGRLTIATPDIVSSLILEPLYNGVQQGLANMLNPLLPAGSVASGPAYPGAAISYNMLTSLMGTCMAQNIMQVYYAPQGSTAQLHISGTAHIQRTFTSVSPTGASGGCNVAWQAGITLSAVPGGGLSISQNFNYTNLAPVYNPVTGFWSAMSNINQQARNFMNALQNYYGSNPIEGILASIAANCNPVFANIGATIPTPLLQGRPPVGFNSVSVNQAGILFITL